MSKKYRSPDTVFTDEDVRRADIIKVNKRSKFITLLIHDTQTEVDIQFKDKQDLINCVDTFNKAKENLKHV